MSIHFKTATDSIRRSPFQALAAIFVLTLTFFVATNLSVLVYASARVLKYFETRPQIIAFLKDEATPQTISALQQKLTSDPRLKEIKFVSKEEALSIYKKATSDNPLLGELVSPSIFPASLEFSVKDLSFAQEVINEVKKESAVDQVGFTASIGGEKSLGDVVGRLRKLTSYIRIVGGGIVGALALASFLVLMMVVGIRMAARRGEVEILKLIGATSSFIRSPIVLEAALYSLIGVVVGWLVSFILWLYLSPTILSYFGEVPVLPTSPLNFFALFLLILLVEVVFGLLIAAIGAILAVSRANKK